MKKFLAFLLIAVIACTAVEDFDFEGFWDGFVDIFRRGVEWFQRNGFWDQIKNTLKTAGKQAALELCQRWHTYALCKDAVDQI